MLTCWSPKYDIPLIQKITALGLDDPLAVEARSLGRLKSRIQRQAKVIVPTAKILEDRCRQSAISLRSIRRIPDGVDTTLFHPVAASHKMELRRRLQMPEDKIVLLMVGGVTFRKGLDMLVHALNGLDAEIKRKTRLWVIGPTINQHTLEQFDPEFFQYTQHIKSLIQEFGLEDMVQFKGRKRNIDEYMQAADVLVHPSRNEGQPSSLLEAMASGLPPLVNRLPGITDEIVQAGCYGYLVNCSDIPLFTAALRVLINNKALRERLGEKARRHVCAHYDLDVIARKYVALYSRVLDHEPCRYRKNIRSLKGQPKNG
ncbi:MAG: glycosyltransferase family 4 protein [candidate division KSB1 bacterium]|nr:glycosyltransferase family 4 protein [candidate division KSB1 bacterium]